MAVPNTNTFTLSDVCDEIGLTGVNRNLVKCFEVANPDGFTNEYVGNKDRLLNFRNYTNTPEAGYFITTWKTDNPGVSNSTSIEIPIITYVGTVNFDVDWGDGTGWHNGYTGIATYDYGVAGTYTVKIRGSYPMTFNNGKDCLKILTVEQWGSYKRTRVNTMFRGCRNLIIDNVPDIPDFSLADNFQLLFRDIEKITGDLNDWDVSNVKSFSQTFFGAELDIDITNWDTSSVTDMAMMFRGSKPTSNLNIDISNWDVSNVTDMTQMFLSTGLKKSVYETTLINWSNLPSLQTGVTFDAGNSRYSSTAAINAKAYIVSNYGWTIIDGGVE